jgi:DNA-binding response OmpR family regulator
MYISKICRWGDVLCLMLRNTLGKNYRFDTMPHVLLVDDEAPLRDSLTYALQKEGYQVTTAADGASALKLFHKQVPDIILLDLMLPEVNGMELCWRIRAFSDVPIVMLTAKDQEMDKAWGLEAGANDYITKPFNTRELMTRIKAALDQHAANQT